MLRVRAPKRAEYWRVSTLETFVADRWIENLYPIDIGGPRRILPADALVPKRDAKPGSWLRQIVTVEGLEDDRDAFFDGFTTDFFTAGDDLQVSDEKRQEALALCKKSDQEAALGCMEAWATTDFRDDLTKVDVPTLVVHGDSDGIVPFEGSGKRTHAAIPGSELVVVDDAPHGFNVSHAEEFNRALLDFLQR